MCGGTATWMALGIFAYLPVFPEDSKNQRRTIEDAACRTVSQPSFRYLPMLQKVIRPPGEVQTSCSRALNHQTTYPHVQVLKLLCRWCRRRKMIDPDKSTWSAWIVLLTHVTVAQWIREITISRGCINLPQMIGLLLGLPHYKYQTLINHYYQLLTLIINQSITLP